jgi:hypothetical protein
MSALFAKDWILFFPNHIAASAAFGGNCLALWLKFREAFFQLPQCCAHSSNKARRFADPFGSIVGLLDGGSDFVGRDFSCLIQNEGNSGSWGFSWENAKSQA